ncbi:hypothetical protein MRB53_025745 [Persea americana]|uniref:Uncharacterized protein n=1 Tax=Persea americana TaxID=3435 RepID=A0ACC2LG66_PERAE|nr:hypothetical protein MRB53_025745 [Persea americana]
MFAGSICGFVDFSEIAQEEEEEEEEAVPGEQPQREPPIDARFARLEEQMHQLNVNIDTRFNAVDGRLDAFDARFNLIDEALAAILSRMGNQ